jgi:NAD(P)-dependent dehydrogenase (short-subunit alcohol dehydrogenase family)
MPLPSASHDAIPNLADRIVLITGATGSLGRALAKACGKAGATVILHGRVVRKLEALYDELIADGAPEPVILPLDFAKAEPGDFANVAHALDTQFDRVDALVHTAAQLGSLGPIEHQSFDQWVSVLRVDLVAAMAMTRALALPLQRSADASVTFTLDTRGESPRAYWGSYATAKAGLSALASVLADEWEARANVRVNAIVPGPIRSGIRTQSHPAEDATALVSPDAIVPLYLHLLSGQAKSESGVRIDAQAWLAGVPSSTSLRP